TAARLTKNRAAIERDGAFRPAAPSCLAARRQRETPSLRAPRCSANDARNRWELISKLDALIQVLKLTRPATRIDAVRVKTARLGSLEFWMGDEGPVGGDRQRPHIGTLVRSRVKQKSRGVESKMSREERSAQENEHSANQRGKK